MSRKDEIQKASKDYHILVKGMDEITVRVSFAAGAQWADRNPQNVDMTQLTQISQLLEQAMNMNEKSEKKSNIEYKALQTISEHNCLSCKSGFIASKAIKESDEIK